MEKVQILIIGASAAGLACATQLKNRNFSFKIIEKHGHVAHAWRNHYDRLHLHTNKSASHLPFLKFPADVPKYPSRLQVVTYLEQYCQTFGIKPVFNTPANKINKNGNHWITETDKGSIVSDQIIFCTGNTNVPRITTKPGLASFPGKILHSSEYRNGAEFKGKKVLVIGFGNSACEIAICLHEHGAYPAMSVRSAVNIIPRDVFGIPVLQLGILQSKFPPKLVDKLNQPLLNLLIGNFEKYGLRKLPYGPTEQIVKYQQVPLLDIGTLSLIRKGKIRIFGDIRQIDQHTIHFDNEQQDTFDSIIMATGYQTGLEPLIDLPLHRQKDLAKEINKRKYLGDDHLFFCGYYVAPTGMLREIRRESKIIADVIRANA